MAADMAGGMAGNMAAAGSGGAACRCGCPLDAAAASCPMCGAPAPSTATVAREVMDRVRSARYRVVHQRPYLARALLRCPVAQTGHVPTVAMDKRWRIYVNPEHAMSVPVSVLAADLVHALMHGLRDHSTRGDIAVRMFGMRETWHVAACCEINDDLASDGLETGDHQLYPWMLDLPNGNLAETYFRELSGRDGQDGAGQNGENGENGSSQDSDQNSDSDDNDQNGQQPQTVCCGSAATGSPEQWELPAADDGLSDTEQDIMRRVTAEAVAEHAKTQGRVPGGLRRWAEELLNPQVDWRRALAAAVRRAVHHKQGRADWTWARLPRRQRIGPVQQPGMQQPVPDIAVVIDTSGSMSGRDLTHALSETAAIISKVVPGEAIRVLAVDAEVAAAGSVFDARRVELAGGGGTDMRIGIAEAVRRRPSAVVVLTDGYTPWPETAADACGVPVIAGIIGNARHSGAAADVPAWIRAVRIDTGQP